MCLRAILVPTDFWVWFCFVCTVTNVHNNIVYDCLEKNELATSLSIEYIPVRHDIV